MGLDIVRQTDQNGLMFLWISFVFKNTFFKAVQFA